MVFFLIDSFINQETLEPVQKKELQILEGNLSEEVKLEMN